LGRRLETKNEVDCDSFGKSQEKGQNTAQLEVRRGGREIVILREIEKITVHAEEAAGLAGERCATTAQREDDIKNGSSRTTPPSNR